MNNIEKENYERVLEASNNILMSIGLDWDTLPDTNSIWDWITDEPMTKKAVFQTAQDCCWDRLVDGGLDREAATEVCYGREK